MAAETFRAVLFYTEMESVFQQNEPRLRSLDATLKGMRDARKLAVLAKCSAYTMAYNEVINLTVDLKDVIEELQAAIKRFLEKGV